VKIVDWGRTEVWLEAPNQPSPFTNQVIEIANRQSPLQSPLANRQSAMIRFGALDHRQQLEYAAMRDTIRQRGTVRMGLVPFIFVGWAAVAVATTAVITVSISTLVPLLVLAAGFEALYALHLNVERIGRYLQVFHERDGGWEQVAMAFGQRFPGAGPDPLFVQLFVFAGSLNFLPVTLVAEDVAEVVVLACRGRCPRARAPGLRLSDPHRAGQRVEAARRGSRAVHHHPRRVGEAGDSLLVGRIQPFGLSYPTPSVLLTPLT
jgi:hypothetical protein